MPEKKFMRIIARVQEVQVMIGMLHVSFVKMATLITGTSNFIFTSSVIGAFCILCRSARIPCLHFSFSYSRDSHHSLWPFASVSKTCL